MTYAVCVTLTIAPDQMDAFMPLIHKNARTSLAVEVGCKQFDVLTDPDRPSEVFLYEVYDNADAFQAHLNSDHFQTFDQAVTQMIADKVIKTYTQIAP